MAKSGRMNCIHCGIGVRATLNMNGTRLLSSVFYKGHTNKIDGKKVKCPNTTVRYGDKYFPQWAYRLLADLPLGE